jgi:hypothetical protein
MNDKKENDKALIAKYRAQAAAARSMPRGKAKAPTTAHLAVQPKDGVFTVRFGDDAKPLSSLGGVAKVLGRSHIDIPEYKLRRS